MFLLDTDHVGILQTQGNPEFTALSTRIGEHSGADFFVSIVSFHEQLLGWNAYIAKASDQSGVVKGYSRLERILTDFASANGVPFDDAASDVFIVHQHFRVVLVARGVVTVKRNARWALSLAVPSKPSVVSTSMYSHVPF